MQGAAAAAPRAFEWVRLGKAQSTSRAASLVVEPEPSGARRIYTGESDSLFACNARSEAITLSCQPLSAADYSQGVKRMFESISFSRASLVDLTSLGELAECLLYYKKVHVIVDHGSFTGLARVCGPEALLGLIEDDHLAVTYLENRPVIATQLVAGREQHGFALMQAKGKESQSLVPQLFQELTGKQGRGRRLAQRFLDRLSTKTYVAGDLSRSLGAPSRTSLIPIASCHKY
jgi:hypothetical protein